MIDIKEYLKLALKNMFKRKLRSWLTIIGIFIGIAAIVALISLGQGLQKAITDQFEQLGTDKVIISPGGPFGLFGAGPESAKITKDEVRAIQGVKGVNLVAFAGIKMGRIEFRDEQIYSYVYGVALDESLQIYEEIGYTDVLDGRAIAKGDKYKVQVGHRYGYTTELFSKEMKPGDNIKIESKDFQVVGITKSVGNDQDDSVIILSIDVFDELYHTGEKYDTVFVKTASGADVNKVAEDIKRVLRKKRNEDPGKETFNVQTPEELLKSFQTILDIVQAVLIAIAAISLMVGGVGIMNTMYTAVLERTREIGIMKAIGAKNIQILMLFLVEAGMIGVVGGVIGVILGYL
ncbi:ABC transporter permease, partial [Candidatus Woesearchaeota archaeon]|nr:ABC transporter permease [Candidatus Woesearchaeota archaeon]